ncbi:MAG: L-threonylcarbamoyladenylate synthase, partial [Pseudomonadota bacterium]
MNATSRPLADGRLDPASMTATKRLAADGRGLAEAAAVLRAGALVAFPTETVYGLGADALSERAVAALFAAKGRPDYNPLIVHVPDLAAAEALAEMSSLARCLAARFWPGALTLVLPRRAQAGVAARATAGLPTLALRVPAHPVALALLRAFERPIAAPSANPSGRISPTTAEHVLGGLSGRIAAVVDGGACPVGIESTVLSVIGDELSLLRPGGTSREAIAAALSEVGAAPLLSPTAGVSQVPGSVAGSAPSPAPAPAAPGMLASHYAPRAALRLNAQAPADGEAWLGFGPDPVLSAQ